MKTFNIVLFFLAIQLIIACHHKKANNFDVRAYGAKGDSSFINTEAIQQAIDACSHQGGGIVTIEEGVYISGTLLLKDNVTLEVKEGAKLLGSANPIDYQSIDSFVDATGQERGNCLIGAKNAQNIGIKGKGVIDGNGKAFLVKNLQPLAKQLKLREKDQKGFGTNRPFLLRFVNSSLIRLENISLRQPAAWTCHFYQCASIEVLNVGIYAHAHQNNDGIDMDSSHDIVIKDCNIDTGDDAICFKTTSPIATYNVKVSGCRLKSDWGTIKFGTESMGDFHHIDVRDCSIYDTKGGGIKILSVDGADIHDVTIENIDMQNVDMPIFVRLGERLRTYRGAPQQQVGSIDGVAIRNIRAVTRSVDESRVKAPSGVFITGTPNHKIGAITLENIVIDIEGAGDVGKLDPVEEMEYKYPEFSFFKVLPAYGVYGRHIQKIKIDNVLVNLLAPDSRKESIWEDVVSRI